ncbi:MAG: ArsR family transcriptional regulator [Nitriliruptor sp.]|nr:MAG: ArsR family transcriptional regulator [Nitriliruptor sp.]
MCGKRGNMSDERAPAGGRAVDPQRPLEVDPTTLKALAHPLRVRMYDLLADGGPATASQLAGAVGESSGTTSYHLRVLAKHGFIEEDQSRGDRRDRWWRVRPGGYSLDAERLMEDPGTSAALRAAAGQLWQNAARQLERWYTTAHTWDVEWLRASASTTMRFEGTSEELAELRDEVVEVLQRFRARVGDRTPPPGSERVVAQFHAFPVDGAAGSGRRSGPEGADVAAREDGSADG